MSSGTAIDGEGALWTPAASPDPWKARRPDAAGDVKFSDLDSHIYVSNPTLSTRLKGLTERGLLDRTVYDDKMPRVEYSLTSEAEEWYEYLSPLFEWLAKQAETGPEYTHGGTLQKAQEQECVCCRAAPLSGTDGDGGDVSWYRTVDGLINMLTKTYAMQIIVYLGAEEPVRYSGLKDWLGATSDTALSTRLDKLEEAGFLKRHSYDEVPPHVEYSLTEKGNELNTYIKPLVGWGTQADG